MLFKRVLGVSLAVLLAGCGKRGTEGDDEGGEEEQGNHDIVHAQYTGMDSTDDETIVAGQSNDGTPVIKKSATVGQQGVDSQNTDNMFENPTMLSRRIQSIVTHGDGLRPPSGEKSTKSLDQREEPHKRRPSGPTVNKKIDVPSDGRQGAALIGLGDDYEPDAVDDVKAKTKHTHAHETIQPHDIDLVETKDALLTQSHLWLQRDIRQARIQHVFYTDEDPKKDRKQELFHSIAFEQIFGILEVDLFGSHFTFGHTTDMFEHSVYRVTISHKLKPTVKDTQTDFFAAGRFLALAINSDVKLDLKFSALFFAKLADVSVNPDDLKEFNPELYKEYVTRKNGRLAEHQLNEMINSESNYREPFGTLFLKFKKGFRSVIIPAKIPKSVEEFRRVLGVTPPAYMEEEE
jgi:hypothetical protein